jgi:hypothetical protein
VGIGIHLSTRSAIRTIHTSSQKTNVGFYESELAAAYGATKVAEGKNCITSPAGAGTGTGPTNKQTLTNPYKRCAIDTHLAGVNLVPKSYWANENVSDSVCGGSVLPMAKEKVCIRAIASNQNLPLTPSACSNNYTVSAKLNPFLAGMPNGSQIYYEINAPSGGAGNSNYDRAPENSPVLVVPTDPRCINGGSVLTFDVTGSTTSFEFPAPMVNADGRRSYMTHHMTYGNEPGMDWGKAIQPGQCQATPNSPAFPAGSKFGKSDFCMPISSMGGIFLDNSDPSKFSPPSALDYRASGEMNKLTYSPQLRQTFFIGDGKTDTGVIQKFIVPTGATRLFVFIGNGWQWNDAQGSLNIQMNWIAP